MPRRPTRTAILIGIVALVCFWGPVSSVAADQVTAHNDRPVYLAQPHESLPIENLGPSDRPEGFESFLWAFFIVLPLAIVVLLLLRGRSLRQNWAFYRDTARSVQVETWERRYIWLILAVGLVIRLMGLGAMPLHGTEWSGVEFLSFDDVLFHGYETLTNPPGIPALEHFFFMISTNPFWFRLPMVFFGVGLIFAVWRTGRELFGRRTALIASAMIALHAGAVVWSQTMRAFLPVAFFLTMALPHAHRMARGHANDRDAIALFLFGALAIWTHYVALVWLLLFFTMVVIARRRDLPALARLLFTGIGLAIAFLPLVPFFFAHIDHKQGSGFPMDYLSLLATLVTGIPLGGGFIALLAVLIGPTIRRINGLWLAIILGGYIFLTGMTRFIIHWEPTYSIPMIPLFILLFANTIYKASVSFRPFYRGAYVSGILTVFALANIPVFFVPVISPILYRATMPFIWRAASTERFASVIVDKKDNDDQCFKCKHLVVTPAFEVENFLYWFGRATLQDIGKEPITNKNFQPMDMPMTLPSGRQDFMILLGVERYWSWAVGQWSELQKLLDSEGCFFYARMHQNCETGLGPFFSEPDCRWLASNCVRVSATAGDELYYCKRRFL